MSYTFWQIDHIPFNNGWDDGDKTTLTSFYDPSLLTKTGNSRDQFTFKVVNFNDERDNFFNPNDKIIIYRVLNSETITTADILMIGSVKDDPETQEFQTNEIRIEGFNFSETVMNALVFADLVGKTIPDAIEEALESASQKNSNFAVTWHPDNPTLTSTDAVFPTLGSDTRYFNKPLRSIVEKYSTNQETGDGDYYWYVNNQNQFVWRREDNDIDYSFDSSTDIYKTLKISKDVKDVKNFIILKGGIDPQGNQIQTKYVNYSSTAKHGTKFLFHVSKNNDAKNTIQQDLRESYGDNIEDNSYPTFPFTSTWISASTKAVVTAANKGDYVNVIREHIKAALAQEGKKLADKLANGKLELSLEFAAGTIEWGLGTNINCTIPKISDVAKTMRITGIQYTNISDTFTLKEDEGTL